MLSLSKKCFLFSVLAAILMSCVSGPTELWQPGLWTPDPKTGTINREGRAVKTQTQEFRQFVCITKRDLEVLHKQCLEPKPWYESLF